MWSWKLKVIPCWNDAWYQNWVCYLEFDQKMVQVQKCSERTEYDTHQKVISRRSRVGSRPQACMHGLHSCIKRVVLGFSRVYTSRMGFWCLNMGYVWSQRLKVIPCWNDVWYPPSCYEWVHCTTQLEVGFQRGFGQWLQLVCCSILLLQVWVFLRSVSTSLEFNWNRA